MQDNGISSPDYYNTNTNPINDNVVVSNNVVASDNLATTDNPCADKIAEDDEHLVKKGENLLAIARQYGVTLADVKKWNNLSSDVIYPCSVLKIAQQESDITSADNVQDASNVPSDYEIKVTRKSLVADEPITPDESIQVKTPDCANVAGTDEHVVQQGESLFGIARIYGLTDKQLLVWNKLSSSKIYPCSVLKIAGPNNGTAVPMSSRRRG